MRHHAIGSGSHLGCDDDVLKKARRGRLQVPVWDRRLIGLLFAGGIIVCCFPISMPGEGNTESIGPGRPRCFDALYRVLSGRDVHGDDPWGWAGGHPGYGQRMGCPTYPQGPRSLPGGCLLSGRQSGPGRSRVGHRPLRPEVGWSGASARDAHGLDVGHRVLARWPDPGGEQSFSDGDHSLGREFRKPMEDLERPDVPGDQPRVFARRPVIGRRGCKG